MARASPPPSHLGLWVRLGLALALTLIFIVHAAEWQGRFAWIEALDHQLHDWRLAAFADSSQDDRIVIVDIDEKSLAAVGRWPWPRETVAALAQKIVDEQGAAVVGFDVVFSDRELGADPDRLRALVARSGDGAARGAVDQIAPLLDTDALLASALNGRPAVLGYYFSQGEPPRRDGQLPAASLSLTELRAPQVALPRFNGFVSNLPVIAKSAASAGHFNMIADQDGVLRRVPMIVEHQGQLYESLSIAIVRQALGKPALVPGLSPDRWVPSSYSGLETLDLVSAGRPVVSIPVDRHGRTLIPFRAIAADETRSRAYRWVSAADVLGGAVAPGSFKGRVVLVGTSAPGQGDLRLTPMSASMPGVEVHANLISGMLDGRLPAAPPYLLGAEVLLLLLTFAVLGLAVPFVSPWAATTLAVATIAGHVGLNVLVYRSAAIAMPLAAVLCLSAALFLLHSTWGYFVETRGRRKLNELFGAYVPPQLVQVMNEDPAKYSMQGRSAEITVLCAEIQDFNALIERLPPTELAALMNQYLTAVSAEILAHGGTLDKYIGDQVHAFWGAPVADPQDAAHAVAAAQAMQRAVQERVNPGFAERGWPELKLGIGINTGNMVVGDLGSTQRRAYTVIGKAANAGQRFSGLARLYGVGIVAGEVTRRACAGIVWRELDRVRTRADSTPVSLYEPLGAAETLGDAEQSQVPLWQQFLRLYRTAQFDAAEIQLNQIRQRGELPLHLLYAHRLAALRATPPEAGWDGVALVRDR
ncbi:MAG TPA: adenylate/guanylate cyclase domain-containing protein [Burkholderiaceae bacterium]|nr:adenylate/guanylate cyclase domain-containing protein [Burkholderiaceae bacterium]